jgi:hypothetical protein
MTRVLALALALALPLAGPSVAAAQHALPIEALSFDGLTVLSVRAPDTAELPVRVVLGAPQAPRFRVDVWTADSCADARAQLAARIDTLSTLGLVPRSGFARAQAFATSATGATAMVAMAIENVVIVVRAIGSEDATALAAHLAQAVSDSAPTAVVSPAAPGALDQTLVLQEPAGAVDWLVTCDGACDARRVDHSFRITRTAMGDAGITLHLVDAFLRAQHVR